MRAKYGPAPEPVTPLTVTFETAQEIRDFRWLISYDVTIPDALADKAAFASDVRERSHALLKALQRATSEVIKS